MSRCPFCERDPYHYVDNGVGMEAVAITCCDEYATVCGDLPDDAVIEITVGDLREIAGKLREASAVRDLPPPEAKP